MKVSVQVPAFLRVPCCDRPKDNDPSWLLRTIMLHVGAYLHFPDNCVFADEMPHAKIGVSPADRSRKGGRGDLLLGEYVGACALERRF